MRSSLMWSLLLLPPERASCQVGRSKVHFESKESLSVISAPKWPVTLPFCASAEGLPEALPEWRFPSGRSSPIACKGQSGAG